LRGALSPAISGTLHIKWFNAFVLIFEFARRAFVLSKP
jgi:hypothetical protein